MNLMAKKKTRTPQQICQAVVKVLQNWLSLGNKGEAIYPKTATHKRRDLQNFASVIEFSKTAHKVLCGDEPGERFEEAAATAMAKKGNKSGHQNDGTRQNVQEVYASVYFRSTHKKCMCSRKKTNDHPSFHSQSLEICMGETETRICVSSMMISVCSHS